MLFKKYLFHLVFIAKCLMLPEPVDVLLGHQISDEKEAIFLIEEPLFRGQQVIIQSIPAKLKKIKKNKKACLAFWANGTVAPLAITHGEQKSGTLWTWSIEETVGKVNDKHDCWVHKNL